MVTSIHLCTILLPDVTRVGNPKSQSAVFQRGKLWGVGDVINVSFLNPDYKGLEWEFSLDEIAAYVPANDMQIEKDARAAAETSYADAFKLVIQTKVIPIVPTLTINFVESGGDVVVRFLDGGGSASTVGTDCKLHQDNYTLTLGWLDVGTIIHEFSHALGMLHEHQNPTETIHWNRDAVIQYYQSTQSPPWSVAQIEANILDPVDPASVFYSTYDPNSVMLYFFPASLTTDGKGTNPNFRYSATDIAYLRKMYDVRAPIPSSYILTPTAAAGLANDNGSISTGSSGIIWIIVVVAVVLMLIILFLVLR